MQKWTIIRLVAPMLVGAGSVLAGVEDTDYDGDGMTDIAVYHSRKGDWYIRRSGDAQLRFQNWGWLQTQPVAGDFDGDGKADICVYNGRGGLWYLLRSSDGQTVTTTGWGAYDQDPVVGDFDGDGKNDLSLYHPPSGDWRVQRSSDGERVTKNWGNFETEPVPGDYDGDGETDYAVFHRGTGNWFIWGSVSNKPYVLNWGYQETEPVQADYDGDNITDLAVYHPTSGQWFIRESASGGQLRLVNTGWVNVQPVPGYYDNDNKADLVVYHMQLGNWLMLFSSDDQKRLQNWGWLEAEPSSSAYRVDDDNKHYGFSFGHDYDDDAFQSSGKYPRTGVLSVSSPPASGGGTTGGSGITDPAGIKPGEVKWLTARGPSYSKAKIIMRFKNARISGNRCFFTTEPGIPWAASGSKGVNGIGFLIRKINGQYIGGKCEWLVGPRGWYDIKTNVKGGYNGHTMPNSGETVWVGIGNRSGTQVSELVPARWP